MQTKDTKRIRKDIQKLENSFRDKDILAGNVVEITIDEALELTSILNNLLEEIEKVRSLAYI